MCSKIPLLTILSTVLLYSCQVSDPQEQKIIKEKTEISIGESVRFHSKILDEDRTLNIYLPLGYQDSTKNYPVIYLLDGGLDEDFIHISGLVQFCSFSWINMIPESIVVGIANVDRRRDFTFPTKIDKDKLDFPTTGKSSSFIEYLEWEVQPMIESNYRTSADKMVIGQSLGGLLATEILFTKPDLFDKYVIVSPSLWWDDGSLLEETPDEYMETKSIYIGVGKEGDVMERDTRQLFEKLSQLNADRNSVKFRFFEEQDHGDALHLAVYDCFEWLNK